MIVWPETNTIMPAIEFEKETLGNILQSRKNLRVPINQRSYKWTKEHVTDLFKDLNGAILSNAEEYFLGTVIIVNDKPREVIEVYDGQQRLATTMILISAIRDFMWRDLNDKEEASRIASESLLSVKRRGLETPHFRLSAEDHDFFQKFILRNPDHPERLSVQPDSRRQSHQHLQEAAEAAAEHIAGITKHLTPSIQSDLLQRWLDFLEAGARVIWVEVADQQTAYRIFETMNDRGLKLSAADLLKNYLYSLAPTRQEEVIQKWQSMSAVLESLGREDGDIVDFIRYFWITGHGHTRSNELFDEIKREVNSETTATAFANTLEVKSNEYAAILTPTHEAWSTLHEEIRTDLETLRDLGVSQVRPLLLAAFSKFSHQELERLVKNAVNWSVRCLLAGVSSGNLEGHYSKNAKKITDNTILTVDQLAREMTSIIPADDRFLFSVKTANVPTASLARYYLRQLQITADGEQEPQYTPSANKPVTLEHILPKNPTAPDWNLSPELPKSLYNRLGNQALLAGSPNSRLGSVAFSAKRPALSNSPFSLTRIAGACDDWGAQEIASRQEKLAELAVGTWPLLV